MAPHLSGWLQKKLNKYRDHRDKNHKDSFPPPLLPNPRPRTLTPSVSREDLRQTSTFFSKLPYDMRRTILEYAFGCRRLHMDLTFDHPDVPLAKDQIPDDYHCGVNNTNPQADDGERKVNEWKPKSWNWWGSVCHRHHPDPREMPPGPMTGDDGPKGPWHDHCRDGKAEFCRVWPGTAPMKCQIGAMGWLLSCHQAYAEGLDVLYRSNTFAISSDSMISRLPEFILPQRLMMMTSLEIVWPIKLHSERMFEYGFEEEDYKIIFSILPRNFPQLRRVYISLQPTKNDTYYKASLKKLLKPIDECVQNMPELTECAVAIPTSQFHNYFESTRTALKWKDYRITGEERDDVQAFRQVWRSTTGKQALAELPFNPYPEPPKYVTDDAANAALNGYWILEGVYDGMRGDPYEGPNAREYTGGWCGTNRSIYYDIASTESVRIPDLL